MALFCLIIFMNMLRGPRFGCDTHADAWVDRLARPVAWRDGAQGVTRWSDAPAWRLAGTDTTRGSGGGGGGLGEGEAHPAACAGRIDPAQEHGELGVPDFELGTGGFGQAERAGFQPLGPHGIAVAVPIEDLDAVATAIEEDEEMPGEGVLADDVLGHLSQAVKRCRFMMTSVPG